MLAAFLLALTALTSAAASPAVPKLSSKERAERLQLLPTEERQWLEDLVQPIILREEEDFFLLLGQPHEREIFKEEFWKRRERDGLVFPLGPGYRRRYEEWRRLADEKYDGHRQDAGRMVLAHGEPASIDHLEGCGDMFRDLEIWTYRGISSDNTALRHYFFYRRSPGAPRKLWNVSDSDSDIFQPQSCRQHFSELVLNCTAQTPRTDKCYMVPQCSAVCRVYETWTEIRVRQGSSLGGREESATTLAPPGVSLEGLETLASRFPALANPQARRIAVENSTSALSSRAAAEAPEPAAFLTGEEIRDRIIRLQKKYKEWLDLAGPLLSWPELVGFLQMSESEKDGFIQKFWRRHSR